LGIREFFRTALFLDDPSETAKSDLLRGGKARSTVGLGDERPRGSNRVKLLSAQGGLAADYRYGGDAGRMRNYTAYMNAITIGAVYKAASVIAANYASCDIRVLDDEDEVVDTKTAIPGFYKLLRRPNPDVDGFTFLEYLAYDLELTGNAIVALDSWNGKGEPTEMFRLRPDMLRILRLPDGSLRYLYDVKGPGLTIATTVVYEADEIVHFKFANPKDPLWGLGVCEAGELTISTDRRMNEFKLGYFDRGAILDGVLETDGDMDDTEYDRLLTKWKAVKEGSKNQIKTAILWQGAHYEPIQEPLGSVPIVELSHLSRNDVLELFGVPPAKVGDLAGINYNNSREADAYFWSETMVPLLRRTEPGWDKLLTYFGDNYHTAYQQREIVDYKTRAETAFALSQTGAFTRNDIRVAAGYDPFDPDDELGDVIIGSTRQQLFPGAFDEPLDLLPMTPGRLLGVEEQKVIAEHEAAAANAANPQPGQPWSAAPAGAGASNGNGNGKKPPPSQVNRRARPTPPSAATRSGIGRSSTGRKSYPEGLLSKETRERLRKEELERRRERE
jgi:HK97 family phage portal protein